jgi:hypothetical protein
MTEAARGYLVRDADSTRGKGAKVDQIYPYTLRGLTEALEEARFRSHSGAPQVLAILGTGNTRVIRRFEDGREVPVTPLPRLLPVYRAVCRRYRLPARSSALTERTAEIAAASRGERCSPSRAMRTVYLIVSTPVIGSRTTGASVPDGVSSGAMVMPHPMPTRLIAVPTSCTVAATRGWNPAATHMPRTS